MKHLAAALLLLWFNLPVHSRPSRTDTLFRTTSTGLSYRVIRTGEGPHAGDGYRVIFHMTGITSSGDTFINTRSRGKPLSLITGTGQLIPGLDEGIRHVGQGGELLLRVPARLGYGERGSSRVPPGSDLLLHVWLLSISPRPVTVIPYSGTGLDTLTTRHGVRYIIIRKGQGPTPHTNDQITVHYTGYLSSGKVFDSSVLKDQPFTFRLGNPGIIPGWNEVFPYLPEGTHARIIIPWKLGYGKKGQPPRIPPKSDLIFDVRILKITR